MKPIRPKLKELPTPAQLHDAALRYLGRFDASANMVGEMLARFIRRRTVSEAIDRNLVAQQIAPVVARLVAAGVIDDQRFATAKTQSWLRQGKSPRYIVAALKTKGIAADDATQILTRLDDIDGVDRHGSQARQAAARLAERRRLGPYRQGDRGAARLRDLGVMARAGHGFDLAQKIIDAPSPAALEEWLSEANI